MKKLILAVMAIFLFSTGAFALDWHTANQITVAWDAVPGIEETDEISYVVYKKTISGDPEIVSETPLLQYTISLTEEGKYYFGVSTKRTVVDGEIAESEINWSDVDDPEGSTPNPFGAMFYVAPDFPPNLRLP